MTIAKKGLAVDIEERLRQVKLFADVSDQDLARWASRFRRASHSRGAVVIRENERATAFFIVDRGELRARTRVEGKEMPVAYFYTGDYFGETGLLTGQPRNATVDVLTDAELLVLYKLDFDQLLEEFPGIRDTLRALGRQREEAGRTRFSWQQPEEVTIFFSTKHWIAFIHKLPLPLLMGVLGVIASFFYVEAQLGALFAVMLMLVAGTALALAVLSLTYHFLDWRNDHYIITSLRVLHVERVLLLREDRDEAPIERVQDVQARQEGVLANLLKFGDVIIQTAAATEQVVFANVPQPDRVREALFAAMQQKRTQAKAEKRESIRQELGRRLSIPVALPEDQVATERGEEPAPAKDEKAQEKTSFGLLNLLRRVWRWLRSQFTFETWIRSDDGDTITWRKNGWLLVKVSLPPIFAALFVSGLAILLLLYDVVPFVVSTFSLLLLLLIFGWWFYVYWDWQNDIYQISGNRLVDLKRRPLFAEEIRRETTLDKVQNLSLSIPGPIAQLLNYGTVIIETAGEIGAFEFEYVHNPRGVQEEIFNRMEQVKEQQRQAEERRRREEMYDYFEVYDELLKQKPGTVQGP